jgi:hypothetical protein
MSVDGGSHSTTVTVVGIDIDQNIDVTEVDTEQAGCIITEVIVVLDFHVVIVHAVLAVAVAGILICPCPWHGDTDRGRPTSNSRTVP